MSDLPKRLRQHRVILKSGDYDGADLMQAWCDMVSAAARIEHLERLLPPCRDLARCCDEHAETQAIIRICEAIEAYDAALQETSDEPR